MVVMVHHTDTQPSYLDIEAEVGVTKHMGGYTATDRLHALCCLDQAQEVLEVGCGIGIGPAHIARQFNCRVVAVDISEKMLSWARQRARRHGVAERITFQQADIRQLPFDDDRFDAVIVESVLAFVTDKDAAIRELIRVTRPGGYVGLNEAYWTVEPTEKVLAQSAAVFPDVLDAAGWTALWEATPLDARRLELHTVEPGQEVKDRMAWLGWGTMLPAWGRMIRMVLSRPGAREALKEQLSPAPEMMNLLGYGLFVGRKPQAATGQSGE